MIAETLSEDRKRTLRRLERANRSLDGFYELSEHFRARAKHILREREDATDDLRREYLRGFHQGLQEASDKLAERG
jgi:hypothetical protein